jgi:asparagine synthase (glutamine-hydrolysing)
MEYFEEVSGEPFLNQMLHVDLKTFLPELNLTYADKMGMAASVETRVPFLDNDIVEYMAGIDPRMKIRGMTGKYLLRKAVIDSVPMSVIRRRKVGFGAPIRKWLSTDLNEMTNDLLSKETLERRGIFNYKVVQGMIDDHRKGLSEYTYQIWAMLVLEIWMQNNNI